MAFLFILRRKIIEALNDEHFSVREKAAKGLGKIGDKRAFEPLIKELPGEQRTDNNMMKTVVSS